MLNLAEFCCQKSKTLPTRLILWERGFFTEKQIFYFVSTVLSKIVDVPDLNGIEIIKK